MVEFASGRAADKYHVDASVLDPAGSPCAPPSLPLVRVKTGPDRRARCEYIQHPQPVKS